MVKKLVNSNLLICPVFGSMSSSIDMTDYSPNLQYYPKVNVKRFFWYGKWVAGLLKAPALLAD